MANYQPACSFILDHRGENDTGPQSAGVSHPAQHVQGVMEGTVAHPLPTQVPAANEAEQVVRAGGLGIRRDHAHERNHVGPAHTCAICKETAPNNYALEKHAAKERHKAFLCTCTTGFVRLATLNRHIEAQAEPKYHCIYCDSGKGFAREDKLIDHLRASHKFGKKAIAQIRSQTRAQRKGNGRASPAVAAIGAELPISTSAGYDAAPGGAPGQAGNSAGPSTGPASVVHGGLPDFAMFSATDLQPFGSVQDYPWTGAAGDFADFDFSGLDFSGVDFSGLDFADIDGDLDMSGVDGSL